MAQETGRVVCVVQQYALAEVSCKENLHFLPHLVYLRSYFNSLWSSFMKGVFGKLNLDFKFRLFEIYVLFQYSKMEWIRTKV